MDDKIWLASFDPGKKNFAFYIEETDRSALQTLKNIPSAKRYKKDGTYTKEFGKLIREVWLNGKTILHINADMTYNCAKSKYLDPEVFHNMVDHLDNYADYWIKCSAFVIEQQMKRNTMAMKLGQHCYSYFIFNYGRFKQTIEFPAFHKTKVLGAPKTEYKTKKGNIRYKALTKHQRKKWAVEVALSILADRDEIEVMINISTKAKRDDISDCILMLTSFKYLAFVDKSI